MSTSTMPPKHPCPQCGAPRASATDECPRCLLNLGLHLVSRDAEAGSRARRSGSTGPRPAAPEPAELAERFPGLEIEREIGRGGMGVVYLARQRKLDRKVALKILSPELSDDPAFAQRFLREARALGRLDHENIVAVHDFGETEGLCWLLMEYVDGVDLRRAMETRELTPEQALAIVPQVCAALTAAHELGIVHRDIKPENVLMDGDGRVKIADFGLAKLVDADPDAASLTHAAQAMGTPHYMAPEQMKGARDVDHRADIFSLGVVFYEMLTGQLPIGRFEAPSRRVHVDVRLDEIVLRALENEPERRYQSAVEVRTAVEGVGKAPSPVQPRPSRAALTERQQRDRTWHVRLLGGLLTLILIASPLMAAVLWNLGWFGLGLAALLAIKTGLMGLRFVTLQSAAERPARELPGRALFEQSVASFLTAFLGVVMVAIGIGASWERSTSHYAHGPRIDTEREWNSLAARERVRLFDGLGLSSQPPAFAPPATLSSMSTGRLTDVPTSWWIANGFIVLVLAGWLMSRGGSLPDWKRRALAALAPAALTTAVMVHAGLGLSPFGPRVQAMSGLAGRATLDVGAEPLADALTAQLEAAGWSVLGRRVEDWREVITLDSVLRHIELDVRPKDLFDRWDLTWDGPQRVMPELHFEITGPLEGSLAGLTWGGGLLDVKADVRGDWLSRIDETIEAARSGALQSR